MKMVLIIIAAVFVSAPWINLSSNQPVTQTVRRSVIYLCMPSDTKSCTEMTGGAILLCPVSCGGDLSTGDFHSYNPNAFVEETTIGKDGPVEYSTRSEDWAITTPPTPKIFDEGGGLRPGGIWSPSAPDLFLRGRMGVPSR